MQLKLVALMKSNGSPKTKIAIINEIVGAMYWKKPIAVSGNLVTAAAKQRSGKAVTKPPSASTVDVSISRPKAILPVVLSQKM